MNSKRFNTSIQLLAAGFVGLATLGCASVPFLGPTRTPRPTPTAIPSDTPAPTATLTLSPTAPPTATPASTATLAASDTPVPGPAVQIKTSVGTVVVTKVEIATEDFFGDKPQPGYEILLVWFEAAEGSSVDGSQFFGASKGAYITGDDGSLTKAYTGGFVSGQLVVGFTPPTSAKTFVLHWDANPPVDLTVSP